MKNILLIGGSYGIGLEIAKALSHSHSHSVYVASRTPGDLSLPNVTHITFDAVNDALNTAVLPEQLHGLVYCPGSIVLKPFKMLGMETFENDMQINFFSLVKVVQTLLPKMAEGSSLLFFSTVAVATGMPFHTSVAAAKGAVEGFAKSLAAEYAPKIRVNVIAPSLIDTPLAKRLLNNDRKREAMAERHPLKRIGNAGDIAAVAQFLLDDSSSWITGQVIGVNGGMGDLSLS